MRRRAFCWLTSIAIVVIPSATAIAETPGADMARVRKIDVKHIELDLRFDWARKRAIGRAAITLAPLISTQVVSLDAGMLAIRTVTLANGTPLTFAYDGQDRDDGLVITLDRRRAAGEDLTIDIAYETTWANESDPNNLGGSNGKGLRFFAPTTTEAHKRRQLWSLGFPTSNRYWFPGYDAPDDLRTTTLIATVPKPLSVVSNGMLVDTTDNGDGTRTFRWQADQPYANHLTSIVAGEFRDVVQHVGGVALHSIGYPDEVDAVAASVIRLPDMLRYFAQVTGTAYPFPTYSQVFVQDMPWGVSSMMTSTMTENMIDDAPTHADYFYLWDGLEAEGLAHQWFGAYVTPRDWREAWLVRGFAHYLDGMYTEHKNGLDEYLLWYLPADQGTYFGDWNGGTRRPLALPNDSAATELANDNYSYSRAALVLRMLRKQVGDGAWSEAMRRFLAAGAQRHDRTVSVNDLRTSVEDASGQSLGWFFDQWVYGMGHPVFTVTKRYDATAQQLTLTLTQTQQRDTLSRFAQAPYFGGAMDVAIDDRIETVWIAPAAQNVFTFDASREPKLIGVDRESVWIKELSFAKPLDELVYQAEHDTDVMGRRWAMNEMTAIARRDSTSAAERERIRSALRAAVEGPGYWRIRNTALGLLQSLIAPPQLAGPAAIDDATISMLLRTIARDSAWVKAQAITFLGKSRDARYAQVYLDALRDTSHVVSHAAATALGQSRSAKAYAALTAMMSIPSWKGENRLSGLNGLKELRDPRAFDAAMSALKDQSAPRWYLANSRWDYRLTAVDVLAAIGRSRDAYPLIAARLQKSLSEDDVNDIFSNMLILSKLGDRRAESAVAILKERFRTDANALSAVTQLETQLAASVRAVGGTQ